MRSSPGHVFGARSVSFFCLLIALGCVAGTRQGPRDGGGGGSGPPPPGGITPANVANCGNGLQDPNEECDDHNTENGDGCSRRCQKSALYDCPTWGARCVLRAMCGDGMLASNEACDDGNAVASDGCSADCHVVEPGYRCPAPGRKCVPDCGDGRVIGGEQCDDGNTDNADGCSATCALEFGADCPTPGAKCRLSVCGNGMMETGESCDAGPLNGLFLGNGTGCSKTCTREPSCRSAAGVTQACAVTCGNGNVETGEECDDGNLGDADGCSSTCRSETGFQCETLPRPDTEMCAGGPCLRLPVIYRDFKSEHEAGGHPDFFYLGTPISPAVQITNPAGSTHGTVTWNRRYCVPNSGGPAKQNDSTARCWDLARANLDAAGKPAFNAARAGGNMCACQFTDWSHDTNGGAVPGYTNAANGPLYTLAYVGGPNGHPQYRGQAPIVRDAASFAQWFNDSTASTRTVGTLELTPIATGQYRFSSGAHAVYAGFFPIDPANHGFPIAGAPTGPGLGTVVAGSNEPLLCNLWPYWFSSPTFGNGAGCKGDQYISPPSIATPPQGMWVKQIQGWRHDFWYTTEARYLFTFNGAFELQFYGDDDLFIYINGVLVLDLGGVHQRLPGRVQVSQTGAATIVEGGSVDANGVIVPCPGMDPFTMQLTNATCAGGSCDCRTRTLNLGLTAGLTYEIAVFHADRHPTESNYQLTLSGFTTNRTSCADRCGNGVVRGAEECDEGAMNSDATYGGCSTTCQYGPYCGDGVTNGPEECDLGAASNVTVYGSMAGCSPACTWAHYCGDGRLDDGEGEECDLGANNGVSVGGQPPSCSTKCQFLVN